MKSIVVVSAIILLLILFAPEKAEGKNLDIIMNKSFLGNDAYPRGIRNNNPGNIEQGKSPWQGKIPHSSNTDERFEQFETYVYGIRAMIKLIRDNYIVKNGLDTIPKLINKYAPSTENNTKAYINFVSSKSGLSIDLVLTPNKNLLSRIIPAMAYHENGQKAITAIEFNLAWDLSL